MAEIQITAMTAAATLTGDELIEVSQASTTVTITAATIGALAVDNSFTDSADGFVAAGFVAGDRVGVLGFVNAVNNLFVGTVTDVLADKLTIGGTDGDVIIDEAEGASVTIFKWETHRASLQDLLDDLVPPVKYRFGFSIETTTPAAGEVLMRHVLQTDVDFADDFAGSIARKPPGGGNPAADQVFDILHEDVSIGSITLATTGTITLATTGGALNGLAGEEIRIEAPASPDSAIVGMSFIFLGEEV